MLNSLVGSSTTDEEKSEVNKLEIFNPFLPCPCQSAIIIIIICLFVHSNRIENTQHIIN